jgi:hypothetical protein
MSHLRWALAFKMTRLLFTWNRAFVSPKYYAESLTINIKVNFTPVKIAKNRSKTKEENLWIPSFIIRSEKNKTKKCQRRLGWNEK